jgi:phospholipid/cholesterol/gamma-HCH transport system substrate-binding protein
MTDSKLELLAGLFVFVGLLFVGYLAFRIGDTQLFVSRDYVVYAEFTNVGGLKEGSKVRLAGVTVGNVSAIELDRNAFFAKVELTLEPGLTLDDDTIASIKTNGLIGDKFIDLLPGGSGIPLEKGDTIYDTESALDLEGLVSKMAFGNVESN